MSNYHYLIIYMHYKIHYDYKLLKNCSCICDGRFTKFYTSFYILQKKENNAIRAFIGSYIFIIEYFKLFEILRNIFSDVCKYLEHQVTCMAHEY